MEANLIFYVLNTAIAVIVALVCLRFLLQLAQANFYNPISQGVNRFTAPLTAVFSGLPTSWALQYWNIGRRNCHPSGRSRTLFTTARWHTGSRPTRDLVNFVGIRRHDQSGVLRITWNDHSVVACAKCIPSRC